MNLQQCRYVEVIARCGSFNQAAKELFVTQPNLSSSIKDLENELGVQLFIRSNMGVRLTEDGYDFLKYAKRLKPKRQQEQLEILQAKLPSLE